MASLPSAVSAPRAVETPFRRIVADFVANPLAVFGLVLLVVILVLALFAPVISPQNPYDLAQLDVMDSRLPPGSKAPWGTFWLGTDDQGRDMGAAFGSGSSGSVFGAAGSANFLSRTTAILAAIFFATSLGLTWFATTQGAPKGVMQQGIVEKMAPKANEVPTAPGAAPPESAPPGSKSSEVPK